MGALEASSALLSLASSRRSHWLEDQKFAAMMLWALFYVRPNCLHSIDVVGGDDSRCGGNNVMMDLKNDMSRLCCFCVLCV